MSGQLGGDTGQTMIDRTVAMHQINPVFPDQAHEMTNGADIETLVHRHAEGFQTGIGRPLQQGAAGLGGDQHAETAFAESLALGQDANLLAAPAGRPFGMENGQRTLAVCLTHTSSSTCCMR